MALGGGTWVTQNKVLPGTYHNFVSARRAFVNLSNRGYAAAPMKLTWGKDDGVFTVTADELLTDSLNIFGYDYTSPQLKGIRDLFKNANTVFFKKLNLGGVAAANAYADAKYVGTRGNDLMTVITANADEPTLFNVKTLLGGLEVDNQIGVATAAELVENEFVKFKPAASLVVTVGTPFTGGTDGNGEDTGAPHQAALDELEAYGFNVLACLTDVALLKTLYIEYTKRMRDETGAKFQVVVFNADAPDHEGVINVENAAIGTDEEAFGAVYWTAGAEAGVAINQTTTNKVYNGEHTLSMATTNTQAKLIELIKEGKFAFHGVDDSVRVLDDINSFTSFTPEKNEDFAMNQLIRIIDQIAIDTANIFNNRYLGKVPNDADGRISLWNDIGSHRLELQRLRAIQNYDINQLIVRPGTQKNAVEAYEVIEWTATMTKLYVTTVVA
jgi:hypothetical protein